MANETFGERTERATPKRREEARRQGQVPRSTELTHALVLLVGVGVLAALGGRMLRGLSELVRVQLAGATASAVSVEGVYVLFQRLSMQILMVMLPLVLALILIGLSSNVLQVGFMVTARPLTPRWSAINPIEGFKRIFSLRSVTELVKALLKVGLIGLIAWTTVKADLEQLVPLIGADGTLLLSRVGAATVKLGLRVGAALLVLAILDYGYQRWEYERSIRMSRQEVEEEQKQQDGDPQVKSRIRQMQRQLSRRRMMTAVPTADVVITNPTHVAVALKYDRVTMAAPVVVAKGMRKLAQRIKETAREHHVPIVEDPPLARLLYREAELDRPIPVSLYQAVAQVLAHVWRLRARLAGGAAAR